MKKAIIRIHALSDDDLLSEAGKGFVKAWNAPENSETLISFSSPSQLFAILTPKRWELLQKLQDVGPCTYRAIAAALGRDVKRVHDDAAVLQEWGLVTTNEQGRIHVPFDIIHTEFDLKSAA